jgi:lysozyme family protein
MSSFELAIETVLANEGGYSFTASDPGGETNFGISKRSYPALDIKNLTREEAVQIYRRDFWKYDDVLDQRVATKIFDASVNMGHSAIFLLQELVLQVVKPDGLWGPVTLEAVNRQDAQSLLTRFRAKLAEHYQSIVDNNPEEVEFLKGWLTRANQ